MPLAAVSTFLYLLLSNYCYEDFSDVTTSFVKKNYDHLFNVCCEINTN